MGQFATLQKLYGTVPEAAKGRYSPAVCIGTKREAVTGNPDPDHVSTSYIERRNPTMRMSTRRFTRLTNAFSNKVANHAAAVALHFMHYNFVRGRRDGSAVVGLGYSRDGSVVRFFDHRPGRDEPDPLPAGSRKHLPPGESGSVV